jgi:hypothetical protein
MPPKYGSMFQDYDIEQIHLPGVENMRIEITPDEKYIYVGKNVLKVLEFDPNLQQYRLLDSADHIRPFIDFKLLKNSGDLIVFDENTSDLIKYDPSLNQVRRLTGMRKIDVGKT